MDNTEKNRFTPKHAFVLAGILILICAGGMFLWSKRAQPGKLMTTARSNSIPVVIDSNLPQPTPGSPDKYGIEVGLSDGGAQLQTPEVLPVATGEPLSQADIDSILARLPALSPTPGEGTTFIIALRFPE